MSALAQTSSRHPLPETAQPARVFWSRTISITLVHLIALLAFVPWFFSWTGVVLAVIGHFAFGMLGITLGYHRLLAHRGFDCPKWLEYTFSTLGVCCLQDSPARWVAIHRMHHKDSDEQPDPHSPLAGFFWSHMGWLLIKNRTHVNIMNYEGYVRDLLRNPYYLWIERGLHWAWMYVAHALVYYLAGFATGWATTGSLLGGVQFGLSLFVWGVCLRTVVAWHSAWGVNSLAHVWGYRNYQTRDDSRNNWLMALMAHGEGWHNNHHADQRAAAHGHRWWEFDATWATIRLLERVGLAWNVVRPRCWGDRDAEQEDEPAQKLAA